MNIPVAKPFLSNEEAQSAYDTILTNWVTQGPKVSEFEDAFSKKIGAAYSVAISNCTTALHLAMILADIGPGDEVICPSMSYIATANSIRYVGATVVFAEVSQDYNLDIEDVKKRITPKTKAILLVHQLGMPADLSAFEDLCKSKGIILIEDAACAIGSKHQNQYIGANSTIACFSFHPRKVITTGDGGMLVTNIEAFNDRAKILRQHGMSINDRVRHESKTVIFEEYLEVGYNYRLTDIQAAVGVEQLKKLDYIISERRKIAQRYLEDLNDLSSIILPKEPIGSLSNYQSFSIYLKDEACISRDELMQHLLDLGISTRRGVMNAHRAEAYKHMNVKLPFSEKLEDQSIIIPLYVGMKNEEVEYVITHLRRLLNNK